MKRILIFVLAALLLASGSSVFAQKRSKKKAESSVVKPPDSPKPPASNDKPKSIAEITKKCRKIEGLFTLYQDTTDGSLFWAISKEQLEKEYIYFGYTENGTVWAGHFRGNFRANFVFSLKRHYEKIEFHNRNTSFYFDPQNPLSRSADANVPNSIIAAPKIEAKDSTETTFLIKADNLLLSEIFHKISPTSIPGLSSPFQFSLGGLNSSKTKYESLRNYPNNMDVVVEYAYDNASPINGGGPDITDPRYVSIKYQHSFIEVPQNDYQPRYDDPRVGYFSSQVTDMTTTDAIPYRDLIHRWHLKKKDPSAAVSEPVEPIVWWIENTTPLELRQTIKEAVLQWNKAFEVAGFKDAIKVEIQPDDAKWDAGDIRYNVLRWTSSPNPPFGGYGPSFVNPRTGQILGADIMLEYVYMTNRLKQEKLYKAESYYHSLEEMIEKQSQSDLFDPHSDHLNCQNGDLIGRNLHFGRELVLARGGNALDLKELTKQALTELIMHEVGHTLGLMHNMKASQLYNLEELHNKSLTSQTGLAGSVMDYIIINVAKDKTKQGHYFSTTVGPYDIWAIEYGYKPDADTKAIASRSADPKLAFGNDADDMRSPGKAIDPRVNVDDISSDQLGFAIERFDIVNELFKDLKSRYIKPQASYQELRAAFVSLWGQYANAASVVSRYVGGVYTERAMAGEKGATMPLSPVPYPMQKKAMDILASKVFSPKALAAPQDLFNYLQIQRRGFNFFSATEDPKIHNYVLSAQYGVLLHLLSPSVCQRLVDSELYGNRYSLAEMMSDLNDAIFLADSKTNINSMRQNLQMAYTEMLLDISTGKFSSFYPTQARSMAVLNLKNIRNIAANGLGDKQTLAHKEMLKVIIDRAFKN
jgi:hypothetical protein